MYLLHALSLSTQICFIIGLSLESPVIPRIEEESNFQNGEYTSVEVSSIQVSHEMAIFSDV